MDPSLAAVCIAASLVGCAMGLFSGLVPGIHVNTLAALMLSSYASLEALVPASADPAVAVCCCIMSASVVHSFVDFVPSVFIGAPDAEDAVSVLPGHRLLLAGRGMEAVRAAAIGSVIGCSAAILMAIPLQWVLLNGGEDVLERFTPAVLLIAAAVILVGEFRRGSGLWGPFAFLLSGVLGLACMSTSVKFEGILGEGSVMMPLLTGLFGIPVMLETSDNASIPKQVDRVKDPVGYMPGLKGVLMGTVAGWFPGITATVGASMSAAVFPEKDPARFVSTVASVGTVTSVLSLVTLSVSGSGRSGTALAIEEIIGDSVSGFMSPAFLLLLMSAAVASPVGYWLAIRCGKALSRMAGGLKPKKLSRTVLVLLVALTLLLNGPLGIAVLIASSAVGMVPGACGTGRTVLCGCLILPVILFEFGVFRSLELGLGLRHELGVVDDEPLVGPRAYLALGVLDDHFEDEPPAVDLHELGLAGDVHPDRGGGRVGDVQVGADGAASLIQEGRHAAAGGGLDEGDHGGGGEDGEGPAPQGGGGVLVGDGNGPGSLDSGAEHTGGDGGDRLNVDGGWIRP